MENKTAVKWLYQELIKKSVNDPTHNVLNILEQALEMEKQQIMDAYWDGGEDIPLTELRCEQYYNETFKTE
jgi:hypothetical protein